MYKLAHTKAVCDCALYTITAYGLQAHFQQTFVDSAFGGVLTSTVVCKECSNVSVCVCVCAL